MSLFFPARAVVAGGLREPFPDLVCSQENCQPILKDKAKKKGNLFSLWNSFISLFQDLLYIVLAFVGYM